MSVCYRVILASVWNKEVKNCFLCFPWLENKENISQSRFSPFLTLFISKYSSSWCLLHLCLSLPSLRLSLSSRCSNISTPVWGWAWFTIITTELQTVLCTRTTGPAWCATGGSSPRPTPPWSGRIRRSSPHTFKHAIFEYFLFTFYLMIFFFLHLI